MGNGVFSARSAALAALLLGVFGCEDRVRPELIGTGSGVGPLSEIIAPQEFDTVLRGHGFLVSVRASDLDGVDSVWVVLSDTALHQDLRYSASGEVVSAASYSVQVPDSLPEDTLIVTAQAVDVLGDTGLIFVRHLIVQ